MKFSTEKIMKNSRLITNLESDLCYLDVVNSKFYVASDKEALCFDLKFEDVSDDEMNMIFVLSKTDFMHIVQYTNEITLDKNYRYKSANSQYKGKFEKNEKFAEVIKSISIMFDNKDNYDKLFCVNNDILNSIVNGSIFVNPQDITPSYRNLNVKDSFVFSSSNFRIYKNKIDLNKDFIMDSEVLKFLVSMGNDTIVYSNDNSFLLEKNEVSMYFATPSNMEYIPLLEEKFEFKYKAVFESNLFTFDCAELLNKLNFISFYAKSNQNTKCVIKFNKDEITLFANDENKVVLNCKDFKIKEDVTSDGFEVAINVSAIQNIVQKLGKANKNVKFYISSDADKKLFIVQFDDDEFVILAKLKD